MYAPEDIKTLAECDEALQHFYNKYEAGKINAETFSVIQKVLRGIRAELEA